MQQWRPGIFGKWDIREPGAQEIHKIEADAIVNPFLIWKCKSSLYRRGAVEWMKLSPRGSCPPDPKMVSCPGLEIQEMAGMFRSNARTDRVNSELGNVALLAVSNGFSQYARPLLHRRNNGLKGVFSSPPAGLDGQKCRMSSPIPPPNDRSFEFSSS